VVGTALESGAGSDADLQVTHWLMPFYTTTASDKRDIHEGVAWVPLDDESTMAFPVTYNPRKALTKQVLKEIRQGKRVHPRLGDGSYRRERNKDNGYVADDSGKTPDFASRFQSSFEMAIACQETMGTIVDRTNETLGPNDAAVEGARKVLIQAAVDLMEGTIPVIVHKGQAYRVRSFAAKVANTAAFDEDEVIRRGVTAEI
jgi:hypothetical protein